MHAETVPKIAPAIMSDGWCQLSYAITIKIYCQLHEESEMRECVKLQITYLQPDLLHTKTIAKAA